MTTITLSYYFGREDEDSFDYQVEVNYANYLSLYLEKKYADVKSAVDDFVKEGILEANEKREALLCKSLDDLADYIIDNDEDQSLNPMRTSSGITSRKTSKRKTKTTPMMPIRKPPTDAILTASTVGTIIGIGKTAEKPFF